MGKQSEATVYYCDFCRKSVIGTPLIIRDAEHFGTSHGRPMSTDLDSEIEYESNVMNKIVIPQLDTGTQNENFETQTFDIYLEAKPLTLYICQDCLEDKVESYVKLCNDFGELFGSR